MADALGELIGSGDCSSGGLGVCAGESSNSRRADRQWRLQLWLIRSLCW